MVTARQKARDQRRIAVWQTKRLALARARTGREKFAARVDLVRLAASHMSKDDGDALLDRAAEELRKVAPITDRDFTSSTSHRVFTPGFGAARSADARVRARARATA